MGLIVGELGARGPHAAENIIMAQIVDSQRDVNLSLLDLQNLDFMQDHSWNNLQEINISRNLLINIDILNMYINLKQIDASSNYIETVDLNLSKLQVLNLSNNHLEEFPDIIPCKKLFKLNLASNKIQSMEDLTDGRFPYSDMQSLNLSNNQFDFHNEEDFTKFLYQLK